jgi:uncharacterized protein (DUF486 family)
MHGLIFFGFFVLLFGAIFDAGEFHITEPFFDWSFLRGKFYLGFAFLMQAFGLCVLIGVLLALFRRYVLKPERLGYKSKPDNTADDAIALLFILGIIVTGFLISALRIHATYQQAPWESVRFVSWGIAYALAGVAIPTTLILHKVMWWTHTLIALGFIAYFLCSRQDIWSRFAILKMRNLSAPVNWKILPGNKFSIRMPARAAGAVRTDARLTFPASLCHPKR